jgi:hypothetical protein
VAGDGLPEPAGVVAVGGSAVIIGQAHGRIDGTVQTDDTVQTLAKEG